MQVARGERERVARAVGKFADKFISVAARPDEPSAFTDQDATPRSHSAVAVNRDEPPGLKRQRMSPSA